MNVPIIKYLGIVVCFLLTDFFVFPISLVAFPSLNTKSLMAVAGVLMLFYDMGRQKNDFFNNTFIYLSLWAIAVSLIGLLSLCINNTNDYTYATYFLSMWIWILSAYFFTSIIRQVHGHISITLIASYLAAVGVAQCICILGLAYNPNFSRFVRSLDIGLLLTYNLDNRLEGISAALDPAGIRFSAILVIIGYVCAKLDKSRVFLLISLILSIILITVVGNLVSRTVTVGFLVVLSYWVYVTFKPINGGRSNANNIWRVLALSVVLSLPIVIYYYNHNVSFQTNLRFGFEGFFSLAETGTWKVHSNDILKDMVIWPDNLKTWLIGDGYIENPSDGRDPYYIGEIYSGFYKNTDIGYLRFIYYFGLVGLFTYIGYYFYVADCCIKKYTTDKQLFVVLLILNFVIWFKVSTDIFQFFAIFLAMSAPAVAEMKETDKPELAA